MESSLARRDALLAEVDIVALDAQAVRASAAAVSRIELSDLDRPTPCAGWRLADLLRHMIAQHNGFTAAARGGTAPEPWRERALGRAPVPAYRRACERVLAAFAEPGVRDRAVTLPELSPTQTFPAEVAISFHFIDYVVHAWDVAVSLGVPVEFGPEVLRAATVVAEAVPRGRSRTLPGAVFRPAIPLDDGTDLGRVLAALGRRPDWTA